LRELAELLVQINRGGEILSLPIFPQMGEEAVRYVAGVIREWQGEGL